MERVREGDQAAYRVLLNRYWPPLVSYAAGIVGLSDTAEDVVQDTFISVWRHRASWTYSGTVSAYLYRITRNLALNSRRDDIAELARREWAGRRLVDRIADGPDQDLAVRSLEDQIDSAIAALPARRREVFVLSRFHGLSYQEIGETMGIATRTVANHMVAALAELRELLSDHLTQG
jgi:RNA polymerase sigma-70 factor (ECF subfamily)